MLKQLKTITLAAFTIVQLWALTHGLLLLTITDPITILSREKGRLTGFIESYALQPFSDYIFLVLTVTIFYFLSYPIISYLFRIIPLNASGKRRKHVVYMLSIVILSSLVILIWTIANDYYKIIPCEVTGVLFQDEIESGSYLEISFFGNIVCILGLMLYYHFNSTTIVSKTDVLFLRKFHTLSDKAILRTLYSSLPSKMFPTFLLPPKSQINDWDLSTIVTPKGIFAGIHRVPKFLRCFDSNWIEQVEHLINSARLVIVDISYISDNLISEIDVIKRTSAEKKVIVVYDRALKSAHSHEILNRLNPFSVIEYSTSWRAGIVRMMMIGGFYLIPSSFIIFLLIDKSSNFIEKSIGVLILAFLILFTKSTIYLPSIAASDKKTIHDTIRKILNQKNINRRLLFKSYLISITIYAISGLGIGILFYSLSMKSLREAVEASSLYYTRKFLREGQSPNTLDRCGRPMISLAVEKGNIKVVRELLKAGANPRQEYSLPGFLGTVNRFPLMDAVKKDKFLATALLEYGADPNQVVYNGFLSNTTYTPLVETVSKDDAEVFATLISNGANPNLGNPLVHAIKSGHNKYIQPLLEAGCDPNSAYYEGHGFLSGTSQTAIAFAVSENNAVATKTLLEYGADPNIIITQSEVLKTKFDHVLELTENPEIIAILKKYGANNKIRKPPPNEN